MKHLVPSVREIAEWQQELESGKHDAILKDHATDTLIKPFEDIFAKVDFRIESHKEAARINKERADASIKAMNEHKRLKEEEDAKKLEEEKKKKEDEEFQKKIKLESIEKEKMMLSQKIEAEKAQKLAEIVDESQADMIENDYNEKLANLDLEVEQKIASLEPPVPEPAKKKVGRPRDADLDEEALKKKLEKKEKKQIEKQEKINPMFKMSKEDEEDL